MTPPTRSSCTSNINGSDLWFANCRCVANVGICSIVAGTGSSVSFRISIRNLCAHAWVNAAHLRQTARLCSIAQLRRQQSTQLSAWPRPNQHLLQTRDDAAVPLQQSRASYRFHWTATLHRDSVPQHVLGALACGGQCCSDVWAVALYTDQAEAHWPDRDVLGLEANSVHGRIDEVACTTWPRQAKE